MRSMEGWIARHFSLDGVELGDSYHANVSSRRLGMDHSLKEVF